MPSHTALSFRNRNGAHDTRSHHSVSGRPPVPGPQWLLENCWPANKTDPASKVLSRMLYQRKLVPERLRLARIVARRSTPARTIRWLLHPSATESTLHRGGLPQDNPHSLSSRRS